MEPKPKYEVDLKLETLLTGMPEEVRGFRLAGGLGVSYAGIKMAGLGTGLFGRLSLSRLGERPSQQEIERFQRDFMLAAKRIGRPVLGFRALGEETAVMLDGEHVVVRFEVHFGEQGRLF